MDSSREEAAMQLWTPEKTRVTQMDRLRERINLKYSLKLESYSQLYNWSVENYSEFWEEVWNFTDIVFSRTFQQVIDKNANISEIPRWFTGSRLNYAENLLRWNDDRIALYSTAEGRDNVITRTHRQLRDNVAIYAAAMKKMGISKGDRVVGYIPNCCEAIEGMLAAASIGAIWSSTSPDFGVSGVLDRFTQIEPKLIFSVNAVVYNGKTHNHLVKLKQVVQGLPELEKVVIIPYVVEDDKSLDIADIRNSCTLKEFLETGKEGESTPELEFEQLPFDHPLFIMYSSGTTGAPKCMVHSAGGTLIQHNKEHQIHGNTTRDDIIIYFTTTGWMMWNWLVGALSIGCSLVLYDGSPVKPTASYIWDLIDRLGVTIFGGSAKLFAIYDERGIKPAESHSMKTLHTILSTGSPLKPDTYDYLYKDVKKDLLVGSITGGTDLISCFAGQNWTIPVYRGQIQGRNLGMAVECWSEEGKAVWGESGELVCTKPFPCMPTYFWKDPEGKKYHNAYFNKFKGIWAHGDYCTIDPKTGGIVMQGRSDGTLNPQGVRFGSAEIYNIVEAYKEIQDSVCVGQRTKDGSEERVVLFLKMVPEVEFTDDLCTRLRANIRMQLSARHVPSLILEIADIPYTQSGKKVEVAIRKILNGEKILHRGAYSNPESLDLYENIPQLKAF
ncbi:unnamed protein product [Owenia fusiformis]|uniref:Acetoacetyl-CoA synthetase n=1 Tax=Owenia fusiformis TaxID=6347 RepID=A0A8S4Q5Y1_OWEFU|nr:unnamed protein product [Owenia fusiformis]